MVLSALVKCGLGGIRAVLATVPAPPTTLSASTAESSHSAEPQAGNQLPADGSGELRAARADPRLSALPRPAAPRPAPAFVPSLVPVPTPTRARRTPARARL